jgi:hypothetical protein
MILNLLETSQKQKTNEEEEEEIPMVRLHMVLTMTKRRAGFHVPQVPDH